MWEKQKRIEPATEFELIVKEQSKNKVWGK